MNYALASVVAFQHHQVIRLFSLFQTEFVVLETTLSGSFGVSVLLALLKPCFIAFKLAMG